MVFNKPKIDLLKINEIIRNLKDEHIYIKYTSRMKNISKNLISAITHAKRHSAPFSSQFNLSLEMALTCLFYFRGKHRFSPRRRRRRQPNPTHLFQLKYMIKYRYKICTYIASTYAIFVYIYVGIRTYIQSVYPRYE